MNMGAGFGAFSVLAIIVGVIKEVLIIFLIIKGIQVANVYLRKNNNQ